ncbi:protein EPIDERMAL PATTERNING FACTOR 1-like [Tripterygium wilfordii]|uniref:protein EPIDERMAL PATTERNING FACTOR 1-like n=1 Tax=Tripterygium wilfordii TaxID=458696 RepID=UPI0018F82784|nr:protein EPIDERMAL PATTERNING FACTOR 1-like [Tripterygium wilfordii]
MKNIHYSFLAAALLTLVFIPNTISTMQNYSHGGIMATTTHDDQNPKTSIGEREQEFMRQLKRGHPQEVAGSRLPDCSHACGSCKPCRLVIVKYVCSSLAEAETCPISYRCICHGKSYPVP